MASSALPGRPPTYAAWSITWSGAGALALVNPLLAIVTLACAMGVAILHVVASRLPSPEGALLDGWLNAGPAAAIVEDHGIVITPPNAEASVVPSGEKCKVRTRRPGVEAALVTQAAKWPPSRLMIA